MDPSGRPVSGTRDPLTIPGSSSNSGTCPSFCLLVPLSPVEKGRQDLFLQDVDTTNQSAGRGFPTVDADAPDVSPPPRLSVGRPEPKFSGPMVHETDALFLSRGFYGVVGFFLLGITQVDGGRGKRKKKRWVLRDGVRKIRNRDDLSSVQSCSSCKI